MRALLGFVLLLNFSGCGRPANREQLVQQVLKADPSFATVLDRHRELANKIDTYQRELSLKRSTVQRSIEQLKKDLAVATATVAGRVIETRKRLAPEEERLKLALSMADEELRAKRMQRASLGRSLSQLKKAVKNAGSAWSGDELARQQSHIDELLDDIARIDQEMATIKDHIRLLKMKLLLIKL